MKFGSNCSCLPTLPTILDTSTVLLPRYMAPLAETVRRISSEERRVLLAPRLSKILLKNLFNLASRARLRATVKSLSTWSSRFIRSTTVITFLSCRAWNQADRRAYVDYIARHRSEQGPTDVMSITVGSFARDRKSVV